MMNGTNGYLPKMNAGSQKDMAIAYFFRAVSTVALGVLILMLWGLFKVAVETRDDTREMKKDWPGMKTDVGTLKDDVKTLKVAQEEAKKAIAVASEKAQRDLSEAEQRVKNEFTKQLAEQIKNKRRTIADP